MNDMGTMVKAVRTELSEAVNMNNQGQETISRACLSQAKHLLEKHLEQYEHYEGSKRKEENGENRGAH